MGLATAAERVERGRASPNTLSDFSDDGVEVADHRSSQSQLESDHLSYPLKDPLGVKGRVQTFWKRNKSLALVGLAQVFGVLMNVATRVLETEGKMHPFQVC